MCKTNSEVVSDLCDKMFDTVKSYKDQKTASYIYGKFEYYITWCRQNDIKPKVIKQISKYQHVIDKNFDLDRMEVTAGFEESKNEMDKIGGNE
jgi:hypothetical protein